MPLRRFSWIDAELAESGQMPDGFGAAWASVHRAIGGEHLHGNMMLVPPGKKAMTYHWEAGQEEWLIVLEGAPTVRTPDGEQELRAGDVVAFPRGPEGAHQVINRSERDVRLVILSEVTDPNVIIYPDSGKVGVRGDLGLPGGANYLIDSTVGYWEGE